METSQAFEKALAACKEVEDSLNGCIKSVYRLNMRYNKPETVLPNIESFVATTKKKFDIKGLKTDVPLPTPLCMKAESEPNLNKFTYERTSEKILSNKFICVKRGMQTSLVQLKYMKSLADRQPSNYARNNIGKK